MHTSPKPFQQRIVGKKLWMNREAMSLQKRKQQAWRKSYTDHVRATNLRNKLSMLTQQLRRNFEKDLARNIKANP